MKEVIQCNVCPLVEPYVDLCWICEREDLLVAHDITVDKSICIYCIDSALVVDDTLQRCYGSEIHHRDD